MTRLKQSILFATAFLLSVAASRGHGNDGFRTVALFDPTDLADGAIRSISGGSINDSGQVAFRGRVGGDRKIFSEGAGNGQEVVASANTFMALSGANTLLGSILGVPNINEEGLVAFTAQARQGDLSDDVLVKQDANGALQLVVQDGEDVGQNAIRLTDLSIFTSLFNDLGQTAAEGRLFGGNVSGIGSFSEGGGTGIEVLTIFGGPVPGQEPGVTFSGILDLAAMNDSGRSVLIAGLAGVNTPNGFSQALFFHGAGTGLEILEESGTSVDVVGPNISLGNFSAATVNNSDDVAFSSLLTGAGITSANNSGVFRKQNGGDLELIAREGDLAPGTSDDTRFLNVAAGPGSVLMNSESNLAFIATLTGPTVTPANDRAIYLSTPEGGLELIAREGQLAPGLDDGSVLALINSFAFNDRNQLAITGLLPPSATVVTNRSGVWATDVDGALQLIAAEGTIVDVSSDPSTSDLQIINSAFFNSASGSGDGKTSYFNNEGEILFQAEFADSTGGLFVSDLVAAPDPLLPGDFNGDGCVDAEDLAQWQDDYGESGESLASDANQNGLVDGADFLIWQSSFGSTPQAVVGLSATVPEPTNLPFLVALAAIVAKSHSRCWERRLLLAFRV